MKAEEIRKKWPVWRQISEVKSIELVDGLHVGDKGKGESKMTSVLRDYLLTREDEWGQAW